MNHKLVIAFSGFLNRYQIKTIFILLLFAVFIPHFLGCSYKSKNEQVKNSIKSDSLMRSDSRKTDTTVHDTNEVIISVPTILAYFPITQKEIDEDTTGGLIEALSDFQIYLSYTSDYLKENGIKIVEEYGDTIRYRLDNIAYALAPRKDSDGLGYLFLAPNKKPEKHFNVMSDEDIIEIAEKYFNKGSLIAKYKRPEIEEEDID